MRVFVAGATGVIGRRAVPLMAQAGHEVTGLARSAASTAALERAGARAMRVDLFDAEAVRRAVSGHDAVVNLATHVPPGSRTFLPGAWHETDRIRTIAAANLADAAIAGGAGRMLQESFAPIYERGGDRWIDEQWPMRPARYNRTVLDAERACARVTEAGGAGVALRFAYFYGPDSEFTRQLISLVRHGWTPPLGAPDAYFSSLAHDDAATAVVAALAVPAGIYNVVDDEPLRRRALVDSVAATLGAAPPRMPPAWILRLLGPVGETLARSLRISNRKLRQLGAWAPRYPSAREGWRAAVEEMGR